MIPVRLDNSIVALRAVAVAAPRFMEIFSVVESHSMWEYVVSFPKREHLTAHRREVAGRPAAVGGVVHRPSPAHQDISMLHLTVRVWICEPKENGRVRCTARSPQPCRCSSRSCCSKGTSTTVTWDPSGTGSRGLRDARHVQVVAAIRTGPSREASDGPCQHNQSWLYCVITTDSHGETPWFVEALCNGRQ